MFRISSKGKQLQFLLLFMIATLNSALAASISINPIAGNDHINETEALSPVILTGSADSDFNNGDTVTVTVNSTNYTGSLDLSNEFSIAVPAASLVADDDLTAEASVVAGGGASASTSRGYSIYLDPGYATTSPLTIDEDSEGTFGMSVVLGDRYKNENALRNLLGTKVEYIENTVNPNQSNSSASLTFDPAEFGGEPNGIRFTIYGTNSIGTGTNQNDRHDEEFLNCTIECDLEREIFTGFLTFFDNNDYDPNPNLMSWNAQEWGKTAKDSSTLSPTHPYAIAGRTTGSQDVKISVDGSGNIVLDILGRCGNHFAVMAEYFESETASLEILNNRSQAIPTNTQVTIPIDSDATEIELDISGSQANGRPAGTDPYRDEDHAFSRIRISKNASDEWIANGIVAVAYGIGDNYQQTYTLDNITLDGANTIRYSSGDNSSGNQDGEKSSMDLQLYLSGSDLVLRFPDNAALDQLVTATQYERTGIGSATAATFLAARKPSTIETADGTIVPKLIMERSEEVDGVGNGDSVDMPFYVEPGAKVMVIRYSGLASTDLNQNGAVIEIVVNLRDFTSSGKITGSRITKPDLISWRGLAIMADDPADSSFESSFFDNSGNLYAGVDGNVANLSEVTDINVADLSITRGVDINNQTYIRVRSGTTEFSYNMYNFSNAMAFYDGFEPLRVVDLQPGTTITGAGVMYEADSDSYLVDPNADFGQIKVIPPDNYNGLYVAAKVQRAYDNSRETELLVTARSNNDPSYGSGAIEEDETLTTTFNTCSVNNGDTISEILSTSVQSPTDNGNGIAVVSFDNKSIGKWQYKAGAGTWTDVPSVSDANALLLGNSDSLRFTGTASQTGIPTITYRSWDETGGFTAGTTVNLTNHGGTNASETVFSTDSDTASITIKDGGVVGEIIDDTDNDGVIDITEGATDAKITVEVTLPPGAVAGDTITVTDQDNNIETKVLTGGDITAGKITIDVDNPGNGNNLEVSTTITDSEGNVSTESTDSATIDTTADPTATLSSVTETYTGSGIPAGTPTVTNGTVATVEYSTDGINWTTDVPEDAGTYNVKISVTGDSGYSNKEFTFLDALTISKKTLTVSAAAQNKVYDGNTTASITLSSDKVSGDVITITYTNADFDTANVGNNKDVTVTGIAISGSDADNYTLASTTASTTANITAADPTATLNTKTETYTGSGIPAGTPTVNNGSVTKTEYSLNGVDWITDVPEDAGTYDVRITVTGDSNYQDKEFTFPDALTISKKTLTVSATAQNKVYDGNTTANVTLSSDKVAGDVVNINNTAADFDTATVGTGKTVTVTGIAISGSDADNYTLASTTASTTANITAADPTATLNTKTETYTGSGIPAGTPTVNNGSITKTEYSLNGVDWTTDVPEDAGTYDVRITVTGDPNYQDKEFTFPDALTISKKTLTVSATAQNKVYDGNTTANVTLSSDKVSGDVITITYTNADFDTADVNDNKDVTVTGIAISGSDADNYTLASTTASTTANITKATLTVTVDNKTKKYGEDNPALTLVITGYMPGESDSDLTTMPTADTNATASSQVGDYTITASGGVDENYSFSYVSGTLKVEKSTPVLTDGTPVTGRITYGETLGEATFEGTYEDPVTGEVIEGTYSYDDSNFNPDVPASGTEYDFTFTPNDQTNYEVIQIPVETTVNKAQLTVTADNKERHFTEGEPTLTVSYDGFVLGDDETDLTVQPALTTDATVNSPTGTYDITFSTNADAVNYEITQVEGELTVTNETPVINSDGWSATVSELAVVGHTVGDPIEADDSDLNNSDANEELVYSITDLNNVFVIDSETGQISVGDITNLIFENLGSEVTVTVTVTDKAGDSVDKLFTIDIQDEQTFSPETQKKVNISVVNGWNLISCPFEGWSPKSTMDENNIDGVMFTYLDGAYRTHPLDEALVPGYGYWIFIINLEENTLLNFLMLGEAPENGTIPIQDGWNLIGPLVDNTDVEGMGWVQGQPFAWNAEEMIYTEAVDNLELGHGYWGYIKEADNYVSVDWTNNEVLVDHTSGEINADLTGTFDYVRCYIYDDDNKQVLLKTVDIDVTDARNSARMVNLDVSLLKQNNSYYFQVIPVRNKTAGKVLSGRFNSGSGGLVNAPIIDTLRLNRAKIDWSDYTVQFNNITIAPSERVEWKISILTSDYQVLSEKAAQGVSSVNGENELELGSSVNADEGEIVVVRVRIVNASGVAATTWKTFDTVVK